MVEYTPPCVADKDQLAALAEHFSLELTRQDTSAGPSIKASERQQGTKNLFRAVREYLGNQNSHASLFAVSFDDASHVLLFHLSDGSSIQFMVSIEPRECFYILERVESPLQLRLVYVPRHAPVVPEHQ